MKVSFTDKELKILERCLVNDDRVQQHYHHLFHCHYLPDIIQHLRKKLDKQFGNEIIKTEFHKVLKIDNTTTNIGIYRISNEWKPIIKKMLETVKTKKVIL